MALPHELMLEIIDALPTSKIKVLLLCNSRISRPAKRRVDSLIKKLTRSNDWKTFLSFRPTFFHSFNLFRCISLMTTFNPLVEVKQTGRLSTRSEYLSIFYALELSRNYQIFGEEITEKKFRYLMKSEKKQTELVTELIKNAGIANSNHYVDVLNLVQKYWNGVYPKTYRIVAFDKRTGLKPIFKGEKAHKHEVCVIRNGSQWHGLKSISRYFTVKNFCVTCEVSVDRPERHRVNCTNRCRYCCRMGMGFPCENRNERIHCPNCNRDFFNEDCFKYHKKIACREYKKCKDCGEVHNTRSVKHKCGEKHCKKCKTYHPGRQCYIKKIKLLPKLPKYRIIAYDMETACLNGQHIPNLISVAVTCTVCSGENKKCQICGEGSRIITWSMADGGQPLSSFIDWIVKFAKSETIAFAHYAGRFDSHFVLNGLIEKGYIPEITMADLKIYQIKLGKLYFRDFWLLCQNKLADLPKTLELNIQPKCFFPHKYNKNENFGKKLCCLPPLEDYCPESMTEEGYSSFHSWYEMNRSTQFELGEQLRIYCENDVTILMASVLKFRKLFLQITKDAQTPEGFDILQRSVTIASSVMSIYQGKFLKDMHIPIIPEGGFEKSENQSKIAVKYFEWLAYRDGVKLRHACNGGEIIFGGFKVDCVIGAQKKIIEFQGCAFHGCIRCYKPWRVGPNGLTAEQNFQRTKMRMDCLREFCKNFKVEEIWECDVRREFKKNKEMKKFFDNIPDRGPINPRDAYAGGRTMPFCLYAKSDANIKIAMFDIISLYPYINYDTPYPVGLPKVKKTNSKVLWKYPDDIPYDGLLKVKVIPPKRLLYPLLPIHTDGFLLFPNCSICAKMAKKDFVMVRDAKKCNHWSDERSLIGTFTSIELRKSLELGYRIVHLYRAYHFETFDSQLFKDYVRMFLKLKVEASGWPGEAKTEEEKQKFIGTYKAKYDIVLDYKNIKKNPGLRLIAKLGLNSLWGKFSMRNTLCKTEIISNPKRWEELRTDETIELGEPIIINNDIMRVSYRKKEDFIAEHKVSNIILSLWTTSAARIRLYEYMKTVYKTEGCKLLYCDTDSLIFSHPSGLCPIKEGQFLGDMSREYADCNILEFVSGGPKQYSMKLRRKKDKTIWHKTKIRGITQNFGNKIDHEVFKKMIMAYKEGEKIRFQYPNKFGPRRDSKIIERDVTKDYEPIQKKGIIDTDFTVLPFGYY